MVRYAEYLVPLLPVIVFCRNEKKMKLSNDITMSYLTCVNKVGFCNCVPLPFVILRLRESLTSSGIPTPSGSTNCFTNCIMNVAFNKKKSETPPPPPPALSCLYESLACCLLVMGRRDECRRHRRRAQSVTRIDSNFWSIENRKLPMPDVR